MRDLLLDQSVKDLDFATNAFPEEVIHFFPKVIPTGLQHGTVTVLFHGKAYEVTTFRIDGAYKDGRRPVAVNFTTDLIQDLSRRDFTMNAMAYDFLTDSLIDPFGGQDDLAKKVLRTVGRPQERFEEDALRILRLYRFSAKLGFSLDPETRDAAQQQIKRLGSLSRERVRDEMMKALGSPHPELAFDAWNELGILNEFFPATRPQKITPENWQKILCLSGWKRWSLWFGLSGPVDPVSWQQDLKSLVFSNAEQKSILRPFLALPFLGGPPDFTAKAMIEAWGSRSSVETDWPVLKNLDLVRLHPSAVGLDDHLNKQLIQPEPIFLSEMAINGSELMEAGVPSGPKVGQILQSLKHEVWKDPLLNQRETLMMRCRKYW